MRNDGSARGLLGRGAVTRVDATVNSLAGCSPCRANARKTEKVEPGAGFEPVKGGSIRLEGNAFGH
eukprot:scaffold1068_cov89-Phaeocystis_antarctica.AAC.2